MAMIDTREAAEFCGLAVRTLEDKRVRGGGPPYAKLGQRVVYDTDELRAWIKRHTIHSTYDTGEAT